MLSEHTLDQLRALRLDGMVRAIEDQATSTAAHELPFDDRLTMLVQSEIAWRDDRRWPAGGSKAWSGRQGYR